MCPSKSLASLLAVLISFVSMCPAATFYIDSQRGLDTNPGTSKSLPWKTLDRVNETTFAPGDRVLFKADTRYRGQLKPSGSGALISGKPSPVIFDMYGQGPRPRIDAEGQHLYAVYLYNVQYIELRNIEITNQGPEDQPNRCGVYIHVKDFGTARHIHLKKLFIHDVNGSLVKKRGGGRAIKYRNEGREIKSRFDGLLIEDCHLKRCQRNGINGAGYTRRDNWYPNLNVVIRRNLLEQIPGDGIVPIACEGAIVEHNIMRDCPRLLPEGEAAAGIWPWSSDDTVIQYNEVSDHKAPWDAQGFDSDWNCQGTLIQYNYSHDNEGGFCLVCTKGNSKGPQNIGNIGTIIRYNVSINDGLRTKPTRAKGMFSPTFHISGPCKDTHIYNNTIYINEKPSENIDRTLVRMDNWGGPWPINTRFTNNIFYTEESTRYYLGKAINTLFKNNLYWGDHQRSPKDNHAIRKNPLFASVGQGQSEVSPHSLYPSKESPCINAGAEIKNSGGQDFIKNGISSSRMPTLGAIEYRETAENQETVKILFIGNSYTGRNNLPEVVSQLAKAKGKSIQYTAHTPGGRTFNQHWSEGKAQKLIDAGGWDFVVLQDQSFHPVSSPKEMLDYAGMFCEEIDKIHAKTIFYLTFAYKQPLRWMLQIKEAKQKKQVMDQFSNMQTLLNKTYTQAAMSNKAKVAPAGMAWQMAYESYPSIALHSKDNTHPSMLGTYLTGLVFYGALFDEKPEDMPEKLHMGSKSNKPNFQIDTKTRIELEEIAWKAVVESNGQLE